MKYGWADLGALLRTPGGRLALRSGIFYRTWPVWSRLARIHRRTLVRRTRVVAVVGSLGKSTTARAIAAALGLPEDPRRAHNSWSRVAMALLRIRPGARHAVIEVGIAGRGEMEQYARIVQPDVTVVTTIASEHHRSLGSLEETRNQKSWMVRALAKHGTAVLNADDPNVASMRDVTRARVITFGTAPSCDVALLNAQLQWPDGTRCLVRVSGMNYETLTRLVGPGASMAVLAAAAVAHGEGVAIDVALDRVARLAPTPGRMQPVALDNGVTFLRDDFKSPIESIHPALDTLGQIPARRRIVVLGDIAEPRGSRATLYGGVGEHVARVASQLVVVGHSNSLQAYRAGARRVGMASEAIHGGTASPKAIAEMLEGLLEPGDVVLVKGRDTQRLDRIRLRLSGRHVLCDIEHCTLRTTACEACPMLERGWPDGRVPVR